VKNKSRLYYKIAGIELAQNGIGISTSARIYSRQFYSSQGNTIWAAARNDKVNNLLASMFASGQPIHRFKLRSGEIGEIRKSGPFYFVAAMRRGSYDVIILQKAYKEPRNPEISKRRLGDDKWTKQ